jgi:hypothetical protein
VTEARDRGWTGEVGRMTYGDDWDVRMKGAAQKAAREARYVIAARATVLVLIVALCLGILFALALGCLALWNVVV